jgi:hypothetical protein
VQSAAQPSSGAVLPSSHSSVTSSSPSPRRRSRRPRSAPCASRSSAPDRDRCGPPPCHGRRVRGPVALGRVVRRGSSHMGGVLLPGVVRFVASTIRPLRRLRSNESSINLVGCVREYGIASRRYGLVDSLT